VSGHCCNVVIHNGNVHDGIDMVGRIDDTTACQQEVVSLLRPHGSASHSQDSDCEKNAFHD
jgi:hypothetical protein